MFALLLYSIICLKNKYKITPEIVIAEKDIYTTDVVFENILDSKKITFKM